MYSSPVFRESLVVTPDLLPEVLADHLDRLYRAAWALCGSREDAEDLVQETYARVLAKKRVIASDEDALPYLLTVLRNTFVSSLRTRSRRPRTSPLEDAARRASPRPRARPAEAIVEAREVFAAIAALPDDQRDVVAAVDVAGLSYAEAAETLGVPTGTIMSRLYRGRSRVAHAVAVAALEVDGALALPGRELEQLVGRHVGRRQDAGAAVAAPGDGGAIVVAEDAQLGALPLRAVGAGRPGELLALDDRVRDPPALAAVEDGLGLAAVDLVGAECPRPPSRTCPRSWGSGRRRPGRAAAAAGPGRAGRRRPAGGSRRRAPRRWPGRR